MPSPDPNAPGGPTRTERMASFHNDRREAVLVAQREAKAKRDAVTEFLRIKDEGGIICAEDADELSRHFALEL